MTATTTPRLLPPEELVREMQAIVEEKHSKNHPVVQMLRQGELDHDALKGFVKQCYIPFAKMADKTAALLYARIPDEEVELQHNLLENLEEEAKGTVSGVDAHKNLFMRFASALGLEREDIARIEPLPEVHALVDWRHRMIHEMPWPIVVGTQGFALEGQSPERMDCIVEGLTKHYGFSAHDVEFWAIHASHIEKEHGSVGPKVALKYANTAEFQAQLRYAVQRTVDVTWLMFDGIQHAYVEKNPAYRRWWSE
jgi:pyrroloquinoline quinone (PQQ) biosynthesis protein C